jgi:transposase
MVLQGDYDSSYQPDIDKLLEIKISKKHHTISEVNVVYHVIRRMANSDGWMVTVSNYVKTARDAIEIFRGKHLIEKAFRRILNSIDLAGHMFNFAIDGQNMLFVSFISFILVSRINKVMSSHDVFNGMSIEEVLSTLGTHRVHYIKGLRLVYPAMPRLKSIYSAFGLEVPK